jgi:hypothetical protein
MEDRTNPPPARCVLVRSCEVSRLQGQLLARAYQQACPEVRRKIHQVASSAVDRKGSHSAAARVAAGA